MKRPASGAIVCAGIAVFVATIGLQARQRPPAQAPCRVAGRISGAGTSLPGATLIATRDGAVQATTSSDASGAYTLALAEGDVVLSVELTGFTRVERPLTVTAETCQQTLDVTLSLAPRTPRVPAGAATAPAAPSTPAATGAPAPGTVAAGRGRGASPRFQALDVRAEAAAADLPEPDLETTASLLPPGFGAEASADAIAVNGTGARVDRGALGDRLDALRRGDFAIGVDGAGAFGPGAPGGGGGPGGPEFGGPAGPGALAGAGGPGDGPGGGRGGFFLGGRGGAQRRIAGTADYAFGGSMLDSAPYDIRSDTTSGKTPYTRQNFGTTLGGPLKIPGLYDGTRRTTFQIGYNGGRGSNLFDQYATVPTDAMRAGDFSASGLTLIDPATGAAFAGSRIPADRLSPQSLALLPFIPLPNLSGLARNYHYTTTTASVNDAVNVRVTHNFAGNAAGGRGGRGGGGGGGGRGGRGRLQAGTSVSLTTQVQYQHQTADQTNVFSTLGGRRESSTFTLPLALNIVRGRVLQNVNVNVSRSAFDTTNRFAGVQNVAGDAGIRGVDADPFSWGVPTLTFSSITGLRDVVPSQRRDKRTNVTYTWSRPYRRHTIRGGGDVRFDTSSSRTEANAAGSFIFTGLYTSGGVPTTRGADFADFLLGLPQQASVQYGPGNVTLTSRSMSLFAIDDWRARSNLTVNLGLRYELVRPFVEQNGHLVNLDVTPGFTAAAPVEAGAAGRFTGDFPAALLVTDTNNFAPRVGLAWRLPHETIVRGGYGVSYNAGTYAAIARQLASQPPFAVTNTQIGTLNTALLIEDALAGSTLSETTNNYGIDKDYALGLVQTFNVDVQRTLRRTWVAGANYTHTRGSSLDIVRAPNRDAEGGLRIEGVQPFLWQSSEGSSRLDSLGLRLQRRQVRGIGGRVQYTLARSRDNAPSIGGGGGSAVVAQNDQDLDAEWGLSNFDRRHRLTADVSIELPFGPNRRWLADGGMWAHLFENWRVTSTFLAESGTPLTPRLQAASRDVAQGTSGALRADYVGGPIDLDEASPNEFFNTAAFTAPTTGIFGTSPRNVIIGPGSRQLDASLSRDIRLGGNKALTIQFRATNLLNLVNYLAVDTYVNSPTFGEVLSVRPMRSAQLNLRFRY